MAKDLFPVMPLRVFARKLPSTRCFSAVCEPRYVEPTRTTQICRQHRQHFDSASSSLHRRASSSSSLNPLIRGYPSALQSSRSIRFLSSSGQKETKPTFDPLSLSSSKVVHQSDAELSPEELSLKQALQPFLNSKNENITIEDLEDLQAVYNGLEYWAEALAVEAYRCSTYFSPDTDEHADSIHNQGKYHLRQGHFDESWTFYQQALEYFTSQQNSVQRGHVLISLSGWYFFQKKLDQSLELLQEAEKLLDTNPALLVKCLDNQGLIYRTKQQFDQALECYQQALPFALDEDTQLALELHIGDMFKAINETSQALDIYESLLERHQNNQKDGGVNFGLVGVLWHNVATCHVDRMEFDRALEEFSNAIEYKQLATESDDHPELLPTWVALGALWRLLEEPLQAKECFQQALIIARTHSLDPSNDPQVLEIIRHLSTVESDMEAT